MTPRLSGLHHVTAIAGDPQTNVDFYAGTLGLRLVKVTVNFDDPGTYHLYYGDGTGAPGTILTFFPWPGATKGRLGAGQVASTALSVPEGSLPFWQERIAGAVPRDSGLIFLDPDGMPLELREVAGDQRPGWTGGPIPSEHAIRGLHSVELWESRPDATRDLLERALGFSGSGARYSVGDEFSGGLIELRESPVAERGRISVGSVHHIAWRCADDASQLAWQGLMMERGLHVSPVMDRQYFRSIYFREPGGVLFEIATDAPGFAADEPQDALGRTLRLPPWLRPRLDEIRRTLEPLRSPAGVSLP
ncbi:MAG: ring-cleaving dioxygenase [Bryobacterales bacterium]|nr:ring-cleaving dioxygenase [Bryobacterales bacterium]